jgi:hypothetical protein
MPFCSSCIVAARSDWPATLGSSDARAPALT